MVRKADIERYALQAGSFSSRDIEGHFQSLGLAVSRRSMAGQLRRMVNEGLLVRPSPGEFSCAAREHQPFVAYYDGEMSRVEDAVRRRYPFLSFCIWNILDIKQLSHYVTKRDIIYADVERDAVEGVFSLLHGSGLGREVFISPSEDDYAHYVGNSRAVVVRSLVSEAPVVTVEGDSKRAAIEKLLVDVVADTDFAPWQGAEASRLYVAAFDRYAVNTAKLLRYARRRGKVAEVTDLLQSKEEAS